jgi:serine phosphatase RsbU (regulator of sigma subunit)
MLNRTSGRLVLCAVLCACSASFEWLTQQTQGAASYSPSAGNPAPYRNGEELAVEAGLPLGMIGEVGYEETFYQIAPGDRLPFVSGCVVEATNPHVELYGFERTQAVSQESAEDCQCS